MDDNVVKPPDLWTSDLSAEYHDRCIPVEEVSAVFNFKGGEFTYQRRCLARRVTETTSTWNNPWLRY